MCGNGVIEAGELCDGDCPQAAAACDDADVCTQDLLAGSAAQCNAQCVNNPINTCINGDGCCPSSCNSGNDSDCPAAIAPVGGACGVTQDCQTTANLTAFCLDEAQYGFPGGYCTQFSCANDTDCPNNTHCFVDSGICMRSCVSDADCPRADYACGDIGDGKRTCVPDNRNPSGGAPGASCAANDECQGTIAGAGICYDSALSNWPDDYCLATACSVDADCPGMSHCEEGVCFPDCASNADCRAGYQCRDLFGHGRNTCAPATGGLNGAPCASDDACIAGLGVASCATEAQGWRQGYCSASCNVDSDCHQGAICEQNSCVRACATSADCRTPDYACLDFFGSGREICAPVASGTGPIGATCSTLLDCAGGEDGLCIRQPDWKDGYCAITSCTAQSGCPSGSHCAFIDPQQGAGTCLQNCANDAACRADGYRCYNADEDSGNVRECFPSGTGNAQVGAACEGVFGCAGGNNAACISEPDWREGYCAITSCTAQGGCALGSHCAFIDPQTGQGTCLASCTSSATCRPGYACGNVDATGSSECYPSGVGQGQVGAACEGVYQCTGALDALCLQALPQGYCTRDCSQTGSCPTGSTCVSIFEGGGSACLDNCAADSDCRGDYACLIAGTANVCFINP